MSLNLTHAQFHLACKTYIEHYAAGDEHGYHYPVGWTWNEHCSFSSLGYMSRFVSFPLKRDESTEIDVDFGAADIADDTDEATLSPSPDVLTCHQSVVFSATFRVPVLYFTMHTSNGSPLALAEILETPLFRRYALPRTNVTSFGLSEPDSPFPLLSQSDHPTLGTPSWYLHPCHTSEVVAEVMAEAQQDDWVEKRRLLRWMEIWFMILSNVIYLDGRGS